MKETNVSTFLYFYVFLETSVAISEFLKIFHSLILKSF